MKTTFTFLMLIGLCFGVMAQYELPVTWENADETAAWTPFENAGDAAENFAIVANPDKSGINTSENALMYTVLPAAQPWVGAWTTAYGEMEFTEENHIMQMMVYKDVISDCALKVEADGLDFVEIHVPNTVTGEWELLTFDFTAAIGTTRPTLVFFPDFPSARTEGSICYVDNIGWANAATSVNNKSKISVNVYPNPTAKAITVDYPEMSGIAILNALGQNVFGQKFQSTGSKTVEISSLKKGIYFITIETANGTVSSKFLKN